MVFIGFFLFFFIFFIFFLNRKLNYFSSWEGVVLLSEILWGKEKRGGGSKKKIRSRGGEEIKM